MEISTPLICGRSRLRGNAFSLFLTYYGVKVNTGKALLEQLELEPDDHFSVASCVKEAELEELLSTLRVDDRPLPLGAKIRIRLANHVVKTLAGVRAKARGQ